MKLQQRKSQKEKSENCRLLHHHFNVTTTIYMTKTNWEENIRIRNNYVCADERFYLRP